jgi:hypothetical protein
MELDLEFEFGDPHKQLQEWWTKGDPHKAYKTYHKNGMLETHCKSFAIGSNVASQSRRTVGRILSKPTAPVSK